MLMAFLATDTANSDAALRALLATFQEMAEPMGFAVLLGLISFSARAL